LSRNKHLLPCRPKPDPTESLLNYVLRLSEKNGFGDPRAVLARAGGPVTAPRRLDVSKLHALTGWGSELKRMVYSVSGDTENSQLHGHIVSYKDISLHRPKLCVECIRENGFVQAHFDLSVMVACPIHRTRTLTHCSTCGSELSVFRRGLLICKCGAALLNDNPQSVPDREVNLLDIIRRKTLSLSIPSESGTGFPRELECLDLRTLLSVVNVLGRHLRVKNGLEAADDMAVRVSVAAETLSEWPNHFFEMIDHFEEGFSERNPATFRKGRMRNLHMALLRLDVPFILAGFSEYANRNYGEGCRSRLMGLSRDKYAPAYLSKGQIVKQYKISRRAVDRTIKQNAINEVNVVCGKRKRVFIDAHEITFERTEICRLCSAEEAAKVIGIPARVLRCLLQLGLFRPTIQWANARKFDLLSVLEFRRRFDPILEFRRKACSGMIRFDRLMGSVGISLHVRAMVIDFILSRKLYATGSEDGSIGGILIPEELVLEARAHEQSIALGSNRESVGQFERDSALPVTAHEAAEKAECSTEALYLLLSRGILQGRKYKRTLWITHGSLARFIAQYVSVLSLARRIGTSTPALMDYCCRKNIEILIVRCGVNKWRQGFVLKTEVAKLLCGAREERGRYSAKQVFGELLKVGC